MTLPNIANRSDLRVHVVAEGIKWHDAGTVACSLAETQQPSLATTRGSASLSSAALTYRVTVDKQHEPCGFFVSHQHTSFIRALMSSSTAVFPVRRTSS